MLPAALDFGVTPVEIEETVYQATAYLGIGRVFPFLKATNEVLEARDVKLPLEGQATTTVENRREAGTQCLPYIGCPRSLNALTYVNNAAKQFE